MFRYQILVEYEGTNHSGWQSQKNAKSIQKEIEKTFSKINHPKGETKNKRQREK